MVRSRLALLFLSYLTTSLSYALFCPTNFSQINIGQTYDQVAAACGKPDEIKEFKKEPPLPQQWNYYMQVNPATQGALQGSLQLSVVLDASGHVVNIGVNGGGISTSSICGTQIRVGDSKENVERACGKPMFVDKSASPEGKPAPIEVKELKFNSNPPATLIFQNGILVERR